LHGSLATFLGSTSLRFTLAAILGAAAALFAITLTAVSGWLIVRADEEEYIMYLLVAIVGVRFFGLGRAALRYAERLMTHNAVLTATTELRMRLWGNLAERGLASRALARGGVALDYLVAAADDVRDLVPRVVLPPVVAALTSIAAIVAVALLEPAALPALIVALLVALLVSPVLALAADRVVATRSANQAAVLQRFAALIPAAAELRANGVGDRVRDELVDLDAAGAASARTTAMALGLGGALTVLALTVASAVSLAAGAAAGTPGPLLGVIVLLPLALIEPLLAHVDAVQQWPSLRSALTKVGELDGPTPTPGTRTVGRVTSLELRNLSAAWGTSRVFDGVSAAAGTGDWMIVEGPSGSGKSTLLATVLGYLAPADGSVLLNGVSAHELDPAILRRRVSWCPQEGHLFDSTVRGNLLLAGANTDERLAEVLAEVGLDVALDYRVGQDGSRLSGGQRQRLAVARTLLVDSDVVLLDEPTAHLDAEAAENLMADLRRALRERIVVLVTHHASEKRSSDIQLSLDPAFVKQDFLTI
jgi:ATP-binding cassette subfamily C protein CydCD